jgi:O-antigen/teichoic acid export membrane protein
MPNVLNYASPAPPRKSDAAGVDAAKVVKHTGIYLLARGLPGLISFSAIPLFTHMLGPGDYFKYAAAIGAADLMNSLGFQWLRLSLVRYLPVHKSDPQTLKSTLLLTEIMLIVAMVAVGALLWLAPFSATWRVVIFPCCALTAVQAIFDLFLEHTRSQLRPWRYMCLQVIRASLALAIGAALAIRLGWWGPVIGSIIAISIPSLIAYFLEWTDTKPVLDRSTLATAANYGLPISATVALAVVVQNCDRYLLALLKSNAAAGVYSAASDLTRQTLTLLLMVVYLAMFPLAVRAWEHQGEKAGIDQLRHNAALMFAIGIPATIGMALLAPAIAHCFLGPDFRAAAVSVIPMIALGTFLAGFKAYHLDTAFQFAHKTIHQVWIVLVAALVNAGLNVLFIPRYGVQGAAIASVLAYTISMLITATYGRRFVRLPFPTRSFMQVVLASAVMSGLIWPLRGHANTAGLCLAVLIAIVSYSIVLFAVDFLGLRRHLLDSLAPRPQPAQERDSQSLSLAQMP